MAAEKSSYFAGCMTVVYPKNVRRNLVADKTLAGLSFNESKELLAAETVLAVIRRRFDPSSLPLVVSGKILSCLALLAASACL